MGKEYRRRLREPIFPSSLHPVVRVTGNFTTEAPLADSVKNALLDAFDQGWADPKKISHSSAKARILRDESLAAIADRLGVHREQLFPIGEPSLTHFFAISGLLTPDQTFAYLATDKGKVRALAKERLHHEIPVDDNGLALPPVLPPSSLIHIPLANGETGIVQKIEKLSELSDHITIDATSSGLDIALPDTWSTATFDGRSWGGPAGLGFIAINKAEEYRYPLPHLAPIQSPGSYSLPLLIATALAMDCYHTPDLALRTYAIKKLSGVKGVTVIAPDAPSIAKNLSLTISDHDSQYLVSQLSQRSIDVDAGSACSPADLAPSHVIAAMGYPTIGHLRLTLHSDCDNEAIDNLAKNLAEIIS